MFLQKLALQQQVEINYTVVSIPNQLNFFFFAYDQIGGDLLLGTDFLNLFARFSFHPKGFSYTIINPIDQKPHHFIIPWMSNNLSLEGVIKTKSNPF